MMVTVIPAKPFVESKKRLAPVLSAPERMTLSRHLLGQTISAALPLGQVVVVSRSANVRKFAAGMGANCLTENNHELNDAVHQGIDWAQSSGASNVLILPLDLPLLTTNVLQKLVKSRCQPAPAIVIAPCRHRRGTNALFLTLPLLIQPHFGPASFAVHQKLAQEAGIFAKIFHAPELAFDLDTPEDWQDLLSTGLFLPSKFFVSPSIF